MERMDGLAGRVWEYVDTIEVICTRPEELLDCFNYTLVVLLMRAEDDEGFKGDMWTVIKNGNIKLPREGD